MIIVNCHNKTLKYNNFTMSCAIGKNGYTDDKYEGDGKTPLGTFTMRELFWRKDKLGELRQHNFSQATIITPKIGWCDDANSEYYNKLVKLPFGAENEKLSYEELWRTDDRYDIIIPISYNDEPVVANRGSAIFFHIAEIDSATNIYAPTQGCIAISLQNMLQLLPHLSLQTILQIT